MIFACSHVFSQMCSLHFKVILSQSPLEVCCLALPLPLQSPHSFNMLSSFRKRRVQVFDQHAENVLPFGFFFFAWLAVKTHWCPRGRMILKEGLALPA